MDVVVGEVEAGGEGGGRSNMFSQLEQRGMCDSEQRDCRSGTRPMVTGYLRTWLIDEKVLQNSKEWKRWWTKRVERYAVRRSASHCDCWSRKLKHPQVFG